MLLNEQRKRTLFLVELFCNSSSWTNWTNATKTEKKRNTSSKYTATNVGSSNTKPEMFIAKNKINLTSVLKPAGIQ